MSDTTQIIEAVIAAIETEKKAVAGAGAILIPEIVDPGDWKITADDNAGHTDLHGKAMTAPLGTKPFDGAVRLHELGHVKWTTRDKLPPRSAAWVWVQAAEDRRLHDLLDRHVGEWRDVYGPALLDHTLDRNPEGIAKLLDAVRAGDDTEIQRAAALYLAAAQTGDDRAKVFIDALPPKVADEILAVERLILDDPDDDDIAFKIGRRLVKFFRQLNDDPPGDPGPGDGDADGGTGEGADGEPVDTDGDTDSDAPKGGGETGDPIDGDADGDGDGGDATPGDGDADGADTDGDGDGATDDADGDGDGDGSGFDTPAPPKPRPRLDIAPPKKDDPLPEGSAPDYDTKVKVPPKPLGRDALLDLLPTTPKPGGKSKGGNTGEFLGHGLTDENGKPLRRYVEWGRLEVAKVPLTVHVARQRDEGERRRARDRGTVPTGIHRYASDRKIFTKKRKTRAVGGTILLDISGSMRVDTHDIERLVQHARHGQIAGYAGGNPSGGKGGRLAIFAKDWKRCESIPRELFGYMNVVDGPALIWLAKQPGPRIWISDGIVTGVNDQGSSALAAEARAICRKYGIVRYESLDAYFADEGRIDYATDVARESAAWYEA